MHNINVNSHYNSIKNNNHTNINRSRARDLFDSRVQRHVTHVHP